MTAVAPTHSKRAPRLSRHLTYPAILLANAAAIGWALATEGPVGTVAMLALLVTLGVLFLLERWMPYEDQWQPTPRQWMRDLFYFGMNGALDAGAKMGVAIAAGAVGVWHNELPSWVALPIAILVVELAGYWMHRLGHSGWLWRVHGVHHTPEKVNTWNNNTVHFLNTAYGTVGKLLPLALLGFDADVIVAAAFVSTLQSFAVHANIDVELGALGFFVMGPEHHRLHHSTVVAEAGNFSSAITLWDVLFGTFVYGRAPEAVGVEAPETFPDPDRIVDNQLHPFRCGGDDLTAAGRARAAG